MKVGKYTTLYVTILTIFLGVSVTIAASVAGYNYYKEEKLARNVADVRLNELSDKVILESRRIFEPALSVVSLMDKIEGAAVKPRLHSHPAAQLMLDSLERFPQLLSIYMGFDDGDFYQAVSFHGENAVIRSSLRAPQEAMFGLRTVRMLEVYSPAAQAAEPEAALHHMHQRRIEMWVWLNEERKIVGSRAEPNSVYDPRLRPWFVLANTSSGVVTTDYYTFFSSQSLGFTVAQRFDGQIAGVIGVDMTVQSISYFLKQQHAGENGLVFIFGEDGKLIAYPDPQRVVHVVTKPEPAITPVFLDAFDDPVASKVFAMFRQDSSSKLRMFTLNGKRWLTLYSLMPGPDERRAYVAVAAPLSDFTASMDRVRLESLAFAFGVILCMVPVIVFISRRISRPLSMLVTETEEIRNFRLDSDVRILSHIKEVADLAAAFETMKHTLSTFSRYLPRALVQQFVLSDIVPVLGGERRELSLLFSDVAGFTTMSEQLDAESLMLKTSRYFREVGMPVLQASGTIDKFIGDAMMAFWNAPVLQEDHVQRACTTALHCRDVVSVLNADWQSRGDVPMHTRFGLHVGECIVGNVGTSDRMNYTAMGANVNIAARLEGLNKVYGTTILASGAIQEKAHGVFMFRSVDIACPKGTSDPVYLYELLGTRPGHEQHGCSLAERDILWLNVWERGVLEYRSMQFSTALATFQRLQKERPDEHLVTMYVERCRNMVAAPPDGAWSPVIMYDIK